MIPYVQQVAHATVPHKISVFPVHPAISVHDRQLGAAKPSTRSVSLNGIAVVIIYLELLCYCIDVCMLVFIPSSGSQTRNGFNPPNTQANLLGKLREDR